MSRIERGHIGEIPLDTVRSVAGALDIRVELNPRARAIDIDRVLNARHTALAGFVIDWVCAIRGSKIRDSEGRASAPRGSTIRDSAPRAWEVRPEVSFSEFGERGVIDLLCWHATARALLVVEIKTEFVDIGELLGTLDRKHRLAGIVARRLGWDAVTVSSCLLVADSMTNRRRAAEHRQLLGAALPNDSRDLVRWLKRPIGAVRALRFVPDVRAGHARSGFAGMTRVRPRR